MTSHAPAPIFVFAVADGRFLHGNVIPNPDGPGRFIGFTAASLSDALVAYDSVARVAGSFSLTTHGSSKVDFEFVRPGFDTDNAGAAAEVARAMLDRGAALES